LKCAINAAMPSSPSLRAVRTSAVPKRDASLEPTRSHRRSSDGSTSGDVIGIRYRKQFGVEATQRMPDQHDRCVDAGTIEQSFEILDGDVGCAWTRRGIAVAHAGTIVGACARGPRDRRLDQRPGARPVAESGFEHHGRIAAAHAMQVHAPAFADVDALAGLDVFGGDAVDRDQIRGVCRRNRCADERSHHECANSVRSTESSLHRA
jgi:hypothetical protein